MTNLFPFIKLTTASHKKPLYLLSLEITGIQESDDGSRTWIACGPRNYEVLETVGEIINAIENAADEDDDENEDEEDRW